MKIIFRTLIILCLLLSSCKSSARPPEAEGFPYPAVPQSLQTPTDRAGYLITHFWENINFADSLTEADKQMVEQGFADFISVFEPADSMSRAKAMRTLVAAAHRGNKASAMFVDELAESYLYSPESPVYNEEYYILYLDALLNSGLLSDVESARPRFMLDEALKNRIGHPAADFEIELPDGKKTSLHNLTCKTPYTILIFMDPDCEDCAEAARLISADAAISDMTAAGKLTIAGVYTGDDRAHWTESLGHYPTAWTLGMNPALSQPDAPYSIPVFPTIYLLGDNGVVLMKNATADALVSRLSGL